MIMQTTSKTERRFVQDGLPWVIGAAALLVYLASLNHWVTLNSLQVAAKVTGWDWQPMLSQPVLFLLTYPCRWLPASWVPPALNLFTAVCAALTLALLARSVALLPHNRLRQQRLLVNNEHALLSLPNAWVPVVLTAVALGLQLTFWENAIAASGEMLDLLLFAYLIRCLLEQRIDQPQSWLNRAALVCGVAVANSWAMFGFLPLFLLVLLWIKRLGFFDLRFLRRMALCWLAGLSLFLVLPLVQGFSPDSPVGFWQALRTTLGSYKAIVGFLSDNFFLYHRDVGLLLVAVSLLPVLVLSIPWRAFIRHEDRSDRIVRTLALHLSHAFVLLICLWAVFDSPFSPRQLSPRLGLSLPFLPLYYLGALSIGYYSGFFLLMFGPDALQRIGRGHTLQHTVGRAVPKLVYGLLGLALAGLVLKNFPAIRATNGSHLAQYAKCAMGPLPPEGAVVLSDDPTRLGVIQAALAREGKAGRYLPVETRMLAFAPYRAWLGRRYPDRWPEPRTEGKPAATGQSASKAIAPLDAAGFIQLVTRLAQSNRVYCLEPSFGYLLERFYLQPHGLVYELKPCPTNSLNGPLLTATELAENQALWQRTIETGVDPILRLIAQSEPPPPGFARRLMKLGHLQMSAPAPAKVLAQWYSAALNCRGVTLQRNGHGREASGCFALAVDLNPDNLPAQVNLKCNRDLLAGQKMTVVRSRSFQDQLGRYRHWDQTLAENGPFDEPTYCYQLGVFYAEAGLLRQAVQQLERVKTLVPGDTFVRLVLGDLLNRGRMPDQALQIAAEIEADPNLRPLDPTIGVEVAFLEASVWYVKTNQAKAERILDFLLAAHPGDAVLLGRAGSLCILVGDYTNAIPLLTQALSLTNTYPARLNRALASFRLGRLDAAEADYQELLQAFPSDHQAYQGLGEIARQKGDTNAAIGYYQRYLSKAAADSEEATVVAARLKTLQQGLP